MKTAAKVFAAMSLLLSACATVDVRTDYDDSIDFSRFSTYAWKQLPATPNPLMNDRIVASVDTQLSAKGWRRVPESEAQTALAANVTTQEGQRVDTIHNDWGPGWRGRGWGGPVMTTARVVSYRVGTLIVDLYDTETKQAIWRGTASDTLSNDPATQRRSLDEGVRRMFANFPPGRK